MRTVQLAAATAVAMLLLGGCGGASKLLPGQADAASACQSSGAHAAALATAAASMNVKYAVLAADEGARAATEANQEGELSDGDNTDDSGLGALAGATTTGTSADLNVIRDCTALGLSVTKH